MVHPSLDDILEDIPCICKNYSKPTKIEGKTLHHKCRYYTGALDEKLEYSCVCCFNLKTLDNIYINRREHVDYMQLYKNNPVEFLAYFNRNTDYYKKKILEDIFESDFINEEIIAWLEKHESEIMREAAFD